MVPFISPMIIFRRVMSSPATASPLNEFRRAIQRAVEIGFRLFGFAAALGFGMVDGTRRHVAVNGKLFARHPVQREACAPLRPCGLRPW